MLHAEECRRTVSLDCGDPVAKLLINQFEHVSAADVGIVLAHPDDETVGCGAQLARWSGATLVLVTNGAPGDLKDAHAAGFSTAVDYANARLRELEDALAIAGVPREALITFGIPDQQAARRLVELTRGLIETVKARDLGILFTHAFEGGHPDHDATAFAVHAAARLLEGRGRPTLVIEMPFYRAGDGGLVLQRFSSAPDVPPLTVPLTPDQQHLKRLMMAAHCTQHRVLAPFALTAESFRFAPRYDFSELPNEGRLHYDRQDWGLTGSEWLVLARAALAELGLGESPC